MAFWSLDKLKSLYIQYLSTCGYRTAKRAIYLKRQSPIKLLDTLIKWSFWITWRNKNIFLYIRLRDRQWDRNFLFSVIYFAITVLSGIWKEDGNKRDVARNLIMWSCWITWQSKNIFLLPQYLWPPNMARWWLTVKISHS